MNTRFIIQLILISLILFWLSPRLIRAQNPISPHGVFIADPSAHVIGDKLYIYGSTDESCKYYCSYKHDMLWTQDMKNWELEKDIFSSKGQNDQVPYNDKLLFAPDCIYHNDTFYLYYCQPDLDFAEGVAVSCSASGPFTDARNLDLAGYNQIDPSVFIDDDGQAYYMWGQFTLKMAKLKPGMRELSEETIRDSILTEDEHYFHEGAFMAKRNGLYYLVYADISRADMPTCIAYATSEKPFGPYTYGGVIVDNSQCNPGNWNNHGSIAKFNGQWYVFYHRSTHACKTMRKACVEPIFFNQDGSIDEVEMTSQGASPPLPANSLIQAEWACLLQGNARIVLQDDQNEILSQIKHGDKAVFKYLDFTEDTDSLRIRLRTNNKGKIYISIDKPWHQKLGIAEFKNTENSWQAIDIPVRQINGTHALWFYFAGNDTTLDLDWFQFH